MKDDLITLIYLGSAILVGILITFLMIYASIPKCESPNGKIVALNMDTTSNDYEVGICQNGFVKYHDIDILNLLIKKKGE